MKNFFKKLLNNVQNSSISQKERMIEMMTGNQSTKRHEVTITEQDLRLLWEKQDGRCHWLKIKMSLKDLYVAHSPFAPSVDRIDNTKGYHLDNIVLCTRFANKGRGAYNSDDFATRLNNLLKELNSPKESFF